MVKIVQIKMLSAAVLMPSRRPLEIIAMLMYRCIDYLQLLW
jgi:hypothetical protein